MVRIIGNISYNAHTKALLSKFNIHKINEMYNNILLHELYTEYKRNSTKLEHLAYLGKHVPTRVTRQPERWKVPCLGLITVYKCLSTFYQPSSTCAVYRVLTYVVFCLKTSNHWLFSIITFVGFSFLPFLPSC